MRGRGGDWGRRWVGGGGISHRHCVHKLGLTKRKDSRSGQSNRGPSAYRPSGVLAGTDIPGGVSFVSVLLYAYRNHQVY